MATKVDAYRQMADHATANLTFEVKDWIKFLILAGTLYKYDFQEVLMINTQRPDATACAEFDFWTEHMGRRIRRGSKGIALLCQRGGRPALRYVFDVADTVRLEHSRDPRPWQYREEYRDAISSRLAECFKIPGDRGLDKQLIALATRFTDDYWSDFKASIVRSVRDSLLDGLDEDNVACRFYPAAIASLSFLLLARFGFDLDAYFSPEDFNCIREFNTRDTVLVLGNAVCASANLVLRQVEYAIKKYERDKADGALPPAQPPMDAESRHKGVEDAAAA